MIIYRANHCCTTALIQSCVPSLVSVTAESHCKMNKLWTFYYSRQWIHDSFTVSHTAEIINNSVIKKRPDLCLELLYKSATMSKQL